MLYHFICGQGLIGIAPGIKRIGVFCRSYGTGTSTWVEVRCRNPACVYFLMTSMCIPVGIPICMYFLMCICAYVYVYIHIYLCIYVCRCLLLISVCMCTCLSGAGILCSNWQQFSHVQERPWTLKLEMVLILYLCAPHCKDRDIYVWFPKDFQDS